MIRDFLCHKYYGTEDINGESQSFKLRSSTFQQYKKGVSKYMVGENQDYHEVFESGNPTYQIFVNQCINDIQKVKVHTKEVAPSVRIPLEYKELLLIMEEFKMEDASVLEVNKVV